MLSSINNVNFSNKTLTICSLKDQKVYIADITAGINNISLNSGKYCSNPQITQELYDEDQIKFMEITSDTSQSLLEYPYNKKGISLSNGTKVIEIGTGFYNYNDEAITSSNTALNNQIVGYKYYLATVNGTNYYGYLKDTSVSPLQTKDSDLPYVFAKKNINIYKYPTTTVDSTNEIIYTTSDIEKIRTVLDVSKFYYTVGESNSLRTFYQVRINNQLGYIEANDIDRLPDIMLVQTNAKVLRLTVVYENLDDEYATWSLIEGKRVRILENRFGTEKYTKIAFNDDDGVTCTGYALAENLQADSWSTLQIIGFILVIFSIILLIILFIVRSRLNHE